MWNYAQHFALNDNSYTTQFGPSSPGAINLVSGQTNGLAATLNVFVGANTLLHTTHEAFGGTPGDTRQLYADRRRRPVARRVLEPRHRSGHVEWHATSATCSTPGTSPGAGSKGGFDLTITNPNGTTGCGRADQPDGAGHAGIHIDRLHSASRAVPILCLDAQSDPRAAELGRGDRPQPDPAYPHAGSGQPSIRHQRLLRRAQCRTTCRR